MGDQADSGARRKIEIRYGSFPFILSLAIGIFIILPISGVLGIEGSVSYVWEERKVEDERKDEFKQIYELIISRKLSPLYDARLKFEFRTETKEKEKDRERTQLLPSLNMRLGNEMTNLNMGWSKDIIEDIITYTDTNTITERDYTHERAYMGLSWRPKWLPHILLQFQGHKREETWREEPLERDDRIGFIEQYSISFGPITLDHNFDHELKQIDGNETTTYDLLNRGNISHRFSFFEDRLDMSTVYELIQDREKEEDEDTIDTWKHHINFNIAGYPADWIRPDYRFFYRDVKRKTDLADEGDSTLEHDINLLFMPHPYFSSTLGMYYNRLDDRFEPLSNETKTFWLKMEPQIKGLIFDPNISMYPVMTSILMSSSTEKSEGYGNSRSLSFLFSGATTIYRGVDLDLDLGLKRWRNYDNTKELERRLDSYLNLDLLPNLKGSISQKAKWTKGENVMEEWSLFDGDIETRVIYRPIGTFMLDVAYMIDYDNHHTDSSWQYNINWRPASKMELDMRYHSRTEERDSYFLGELNLYITQTIHLELRYQSPSDDQRIRVEFGLRF